MEVFELVIALLLGGAILAAMARRMATPYPALVAIAGAALALFPRVPTLVLDPELALALFVAPVLLDAAFDASQRDLRANWRVVAGLALGAVVLTVIVVAVVARALVPGLDRKQRARHVPLPPGPGRPERRDPVRPGEQDLRDQHLQRGDHGQRRGQPGGDEDVE